MRLEEIGAAVLINADCRVVMEAMPEASVDSVVCDPPYGLNFMGKGWDRGVPGVEFWTGALRVAKPGAYLLAFGGTRTYHRLACAIEDAGWEIRDTVMWVYGSGFPKSHNGEWGGTALKPAWEPIILARKAPVGIVEANWRAYGTGGLNINECRVGDEVRFNAAAANASGGNSLNMSVVGMPRTTGRECVGRWPANLIHDGSDEVLECFPAAPGQQRQVGSEHGAKPSINAYGDFGPRETFMPRGDAGSAARFFYCAKASKSDRNEGCEALPDREGGIRSETSGQHITRRDGNDPGPVKNNHPTVKPTALMQYLCRLVTPVGGLILDPFTGSGSTGKAALREGFRFIGCENDLEHGYFEIACARVRGTYVEGPTTLQ